MKIAGLILLGVGVLLFLIVELIMPPGNDANGLIPLQFLIVAVSIVLVLIGIVLFVISLF